ncbi:MAG: bcp [Candidatus Peribacteria bacterium]|nr:bcp [Candidatus Peribacteria bacterium]
MSPDLHSPAPDFTLPDQDGTMHTLGSYKGQWVLLYFYPKDDTPGCTKEACGFRDLQKEFAAKNARIFGISTNSVKSHRKFADTYALPFTLLADEQKEVVQAYNVWKPKKFMGREYLGTLRTSFLINPEGTIVKIYENVSPEEHPREVLQDIQAHS